MPKLQHTAASAWQGSYRTGAGHLSTAGLPTWLFHVPAQCRGQHAKGCTGPRLEEAAAAISGLPVRTRAACTQLRHDSQTPTGLRCGRLMSIRHAMRPVGRWQPLSLRLAHTHASIHWAPPLWCCGVPHLCRNGLKWFIYMCPSTGLGVGHQASSIHGFSKAVCGLACTRQMP